MSAWAETSVKAKGDSRADYPPLEGEECGGCHRELHQGERVFRLCKPDEIRVLPAQDVGSDPWVCEACLSSPPVHRVGGVAKDLQGVADEWPFDDDPPDPL